MSIDVFSDELLSLKEASATIPGRPHFVSLHRWCKEGLRGVRLSTVLVGGTRYTTKRALNAFFEATANAATPQSLKGASTRTPNPASAKRTARIEKQHAAKRPTGRKRRPRKTPV
jgi:hypothetical protein